MMGISITPKPGFAWSAVNNCTDEESEKIYWR